MKTIWTGRVAQASARYAENAPLVATCCNACRTCVTTNVLTVAMAGIIGAGCAVANFARRHLPDRTKGGDMQQCDCGPDCPCGDDCAC